MPYKDPNKRYQKTRNWIRRNPERTMAWREKNPEKIAMYAKSVADRRRKAYFDKHGYYFDDRPIFNGREYVKQIKEGTPCFDCGKFFPFFVMDFDHVRGEKVKEIAKVVDSWGKKRLDEEIAKCDLVCSNCHRFRTFGVKQFEKQGRVQMG